MLQYTGCLILFSNVPKSDVADVSFITNSLNCKIGYIYS